MTRSSGLRVACAVYVAVLAVGCAKQKPAESSTSLTSSEPVGVSTAVTPAANTPTNDVPEWMSSRRDGGASMTSAPYGSTYGVDGMERKDGGYFATSTSSDPSAPPAPTTSSDSASPPRVAQTQGQDTADLGITQKIRKQIDGDDALSMTAKSVTVVTLQGRVVLRGNVRSEIEKKRIELYAKDAAGANNVDSFLTVVP